MKNDIYTENLADFGARERALLGKLLSLPLPKTFDNTGVKAAFNRNSGYVFLVNEDYQCAMINPKTGNLEIFHSTPYNGDEGFITDLLKKPVSAYHPDDVEYIRDAAKNEGVKLPKAWKEA